MKTKPYGIYDIIHGEVNIHSVRNSLERLLVHIEQGKVGHKQGVWTWDEVVNSISCYVLIMKQELHNNKKR